MYVSLNYLDNGDEVLRTFVCRLAQDIYMPVYSSGRHDDETDSKTNGISILESAF